MRFQEVGLQRLEKEEGQEEQLYQLRLALEQLGNAIHISSLSREPSMGQRAKLNQYQLQYRQLQFQNPQLQPQITHSESTGVVVQYMSQSKPSVLVSVRDAVSAFHR